MRRSVQRLWCGALIALTAPACGDSTDTLPVYEDSLEPIASGPWLQPEDWAIVHPADDPLLNHANAPAPCPDDAFRLEHGAPELDTGACAWITLAAPTRYALDAGTPIRIALLHDDLIANAPATSTFTIATAHETLYTRTVPIPSPAQVVEHTATLRAPLQAGALIYVHVHNHGANTYTLIELSPE